MAEFEFKRFTINQRIEHILFFVAFILLAYTGFPLMFPDEWWSKWMIASVGGFDSRTFIHHYSGLLMIGVSIYHVVFHIALEKPRFDILFNPEDIRDFLQQLRYFLHYSNKRPVFGRYTWKQKFEYFGAAVGAVIMGFTGILMWHPFEAMRFLPIGIIQISDLFHRWEAVLASLAVFIGHFYDEHFVKFPNMSWLTGIIPEEEMREEHPLEYEAAMRTLKTNELKEKENKKENNKIIIAFAKLLFTIIFLVIFIWLVWIAYKLLSEAIATYLL